MKKIKFALVAVALMVASIASAQTSFGIRGGVNMSNVYGDEYSDKNMKAGGHVGLAMDYEFMPNMSFQTGLYFTTKGAKYTGSFMSVTGEVNQNMYYLQVPMHFAYKIPIATSTRFVLHAGPYIAYAVGGQTKVSLNDKELIKKDTFTDNGLNRFDAGLGLGADFEYNRFVFGLGWDFGLVNIAPENAGTLKNQNGYLSVGYMF